jgi:CrcB protein
LNKPTLPVAIALAALGGAAGTAVRAASQWLGEALQLSPWVATLCVNVAASFAAGLLGRLLLGHVTRRQAMAVDVVDPFEARAHRDAMLFVTGFCGGLSTFSALAVELLELMRQQRFAQCGVVVGLSLTLGIGAAWAGLALGWRLHRRR